MADEFGWVIERGDSPVSAPKYWVAGSWSDDHLQAVRFSRHSDALRVRDFILEPNIPAHRVCEHGWN